MDIVTLGELLIDFTEAGVSESGIRRFDQNPGGAPANVACCVAKLGLQSAFIGKVGTDLHGAFLKETLCRYNVNTDGLVCTEDFFTTLAFVALGDNGERRFSFARKPGADIMLRTEELHMELLKNTKILSIGSLSLTHEPACSATLEAVRIAKAAGALIAYDPNYRAPLWKSEAQAIEQMRSLIPYTDLMKISDEETALLTGFSDPEMALQALYHQGVRFAVVTMGKDGALICVDGKIKHVEGFACQAVDTTGAGDAFWGGLQYAILTSGINFEDITVDNACRYARFANAVAACCVQKRGAIPAMPDYQEVERLLREPVK